MTTANLELLALSALPLGLVAARLARTPAPPRVKRRLSTRRPRRGDPFEMTFDVQAGDDPVEVHATIPDAFRLDAGSNLRVLSPNRADRTSASLVSTGRGHHTFAAVDVETIDSVGLLAPQSALMDSPVEVDVRPNIGDARRGRHHSRRTSDARPQGDVALHGADSADFRELRGYAWGDPPKAINWKASARKLSAATDNPHAAEPLVNEYEKEGRRTVILLLDAGASLRVGTSAETGIDHAIEAALTLAQHHLSRGARVGAATLHAQAGPVAPPDTGRTRAAGLERALTPGALDDTRTPRHVLPLLERHLEGRRPTIYLLTRITDDNAPALIELAHRVRARHARRRGTPLVIVDQQALRLTPAHDAAFTTARYLIERQDAAAAQRVAHAGALVIPWDPTEQDVRALLSRRGLG